MSVTRARGGRCPCLVTGHCSSRPSAHSAPRRLPKICTAFSEGYYGKAGEKFQELERVETTQHFRDNVLEHPEEVSSPSFVFLLAFIYWIEGDAQVGGVME